MSIQIPKKFTNPDFNPRKPMPEYMLAQLDEFMKTLGDLSCIVINIDGTIIAGHQRNGMFNINANHVNIIEQYDKPTESGTIAWGEIEFAGSTFRVRYVDFPSEKMHLANLIANKFESEFDKDMLAAYFSEENLIEVGLPDKLISEVFSDNYNIPAIPKELSMPNVKDKAVPTSILYSTGWFIWNPKKERYDPRSFTMTPEEQQQIQDLLKQHQQIVPSGEGFVQLLLDDFLSRNPEFERIVNAYLPDEDLEEDFVEAS